MLFIAGGCGAVIGLSTLGCTFSVALRISLSAHRGCTAAISGILAATLIPIIATNASIFLSIAAIAFTAMLGTAVLSAHWSLGGYQTFGRSTDQILAATCTQRLSYTVKILRTVELQQRSLLLFFVIIGGAEDLSSRQRVDARIIHNGRGRTRRGIEILHLLGRIMIALEALCQINSIPHGRARMAGHQIRHQILLLAKSRTKLEILFAEALVNAEMRFTHAIQYTVGAMLGRNLELTADMVTHQLAEKAVIPIRHQIVKSDTGTDKDLFHTGNCLNGLQQSDILAVIDHQIFTRGRSEAFAIGANARLFLLFAGGCTEICRGTADIVDISLKTGQLSDLFRLGNTALDAS